jgi:hypothetical protein
MEITEANMFGNNICEGAVCHRVLVPRITDNESFPLFAEKLFVMAIAEIQATAPTAPQLAVRMQPVAWLPELAVCLIV